MWGYITTTTNGNTVYVFFGGKGTGDIYTYTFENYVKWNNSTTTINN